MLRHAVWGGGTLTARFVFKIATTFRFLEREFKQGVPVIASNDYHPPAAGGRPVQGFPVHEPLRVVLPPLQHPAVSASSMPLWSSTKSTAAAAVR